MPKIFIQAVDEPVVIQVSPPPTDGSTSVFSLSVGYAVSIEAGDYADADSITVTASSPTMDQATTVTVKVLTPEEAQAQGLNN